MVAFGPDRQGRAQIVASAHSQVVDARGREGLPQVQALGRGGGGRERAVCDVNDRNMRPLLLQRDQSTHKSSVERQDNEGQALRPCTQPGVGNERPKGGAQLGQAARSRPGQDREQPTPALCVRREADRPPVVLGQQQGDRVTGSERVVGYRSSGLDGHLEVGLGGLAEDARSRSVEKHRHATVRRVLHLPQHQAARLGRGLPIHTVQRFHGVVRPDTAEL